ncbi:MAG: ABC transporter permease [Actinomycetota bacterium]|nr:ABC transporter permease [Actinomycetota bacterium]
MRAALAYEWMRLRTVRSTYWLIGLSFAFQLIVTMLIAWQLPESGPLSGGDGPVTQLVTVGAASGVAPLFLAYIVGIVGVFSMGHEYRHGMIRATLTAIPSRTAVFVAKLLTTGVVAAGAAIGCVAIGLLSAVVFGVDMATFDRLSKLTFGVVLFTVLFTWSGLAYSALLRNQTAAVAMLMLVPTVVESIIRAVVIAIKAGSDDPSGRGGYVSILKYLPYDAGGQMYTRASLDDLLSFLGYTPFGAVGGGIVFGTFVGGLLALAYALFLRRDA